MNLRKSIIAGSWYPGEPAKLKSEINKYLGAAKESAEKSELLGIIVPHAGYMYSGPVAAYAYKNLAGRDIKTVVLIGPSHRAYFEGAAVYASGAWETPLGKVEIDEALAKKIIANDSAYIHDLPKVHAEEHSLEIQLPFLQSVLKPEFRIVPIMLFDHSLASCERLAQAVAEAVKDRPDILLLASSDLSHYHADAEAKKLDKLVVSSVEKYDPEKLAGDLTLKKCEACGGGPIVAVMQACRFLGADKSIVYDYRTSGDVVGERAQVVGYLAAGLYKTKMQKSEIRNQKNNKSQSETGKLTPEEKKELFRIAHAAIEAEVKGSPASAFKPLTPVLSELRGVFVTLKKGGQLRGCIGYIEGIKPLHLAVAEMAVAAATGDPRFPPVTKDELPQLEYEISVLTPKRQIADPSEFIVGKHGIIVQRDGRSGVFLPQVAPEEGWDRETTLTYLCLHKAGLPPDAWKDKRTKLFVFEAEVVEEKDLK
ncbi:MAG: AmmeMemoRadiSam system protein B [Candidatus Edwardsbacteria bacterium]|nr:AmmeMemoRadiSam system protein B [Candidatus Edwardsbacteria bacterium]